MLVSEFIGTFKLRWVGGFVNHQAIDFVYNFYYKRGS